MFARRGPGSPPTPPDVEFPLRGQTTLDQFLRARLRGEPEVGQSVRVEPVRLSVREVANGRVETVGLSLNPTPDSERKAAGSA
ncbi:MAG TPA: transporter associated domain-containing protein [Gemmatimonadales bacterium]|nr:transporter associated domain-containing protein [Gemmatimonadales bacterium]